MALKLQAARGAKSHRGYCTHFYAQYRNGKRVVTKALKTRVRGTPPKSGLLTDSGDAEFEKSKAAALVEYERLLSDTKDVNRAISQGCGMIETATGRETSDLPLSKLAAWQRQHEQRKETESNAGWLEWHDTVINRFADWAKERKCYTVFKVTRELAIEYGRELANGHLTCGTVKKVLHRLSTAFRNYLPGVLKNPFEGVYPIAVADIAKEDRKEVARKPMDADEVRALWEVARKDDTMWYDIAVCATCTGMRIGDCCNLTWDAVNLAENYINVTTAKTGAQVMIPLWDYDTESEAYHEILGEFRRVLDGANTDATGKDTIWVFPNAHAKYTASQSVVSAHGKVLFGKALAANAKQVEVVEDRKPMTSGEIQAAIANAPWNDAKRTRILRLYTQFTGGKTYREIEASENYPRNRISMDFAEIERLTGERIRPQAGKKTTRDVLTLTRETRKVGARSASVYGWHSLRHAWVVLMLDEGIPKEDVQAVVGHSTFDMTMRYYNPTEKQRVARMRKALGHGRRKAPKAIGCASATPAAPAGVPAVAAPSIDSLVANMSEAQRKALAAKLLGL